MKIAVVEPHADDAFLSLGAHMEDWIKKGKEVTIITVYHDIKRGNEAEAYARAIGAEWRGVGLPEHGGGLAEAFEVPTPGLGWVLREFSRVYAPLGLQHPEHRAVARALPGAYVYLEIPYAYKLKNRAEVDELTSFPEYGLYSILTAHGRKARHTGIFKSQSKFFFYNDPKELVRHPEIILHGHYYQTEG